MAFIYFENFFDDALNQSCIPRPELYKSEHIVYLLCSYKHFFQHVSLLLLIRVGLVTT